MAGTGKAHLRDGEVLLRVDDLVVEFPIGRGLTVSAVAGISFDVRRGETLGTLQEAMHAAALREHAGSSLSPSAYT